MLRMNLSINNCRDQCYDRAANMAGSRRGIATQISTEEPLATFFIHCYSHALKFGCQRHCKEEQNSYKCFGHSVGDITAHKVLSKTRCQLCTTQRTTASGNHLISNVLPYKINCHRFVAHKCVDNYAVFQVL